ncbi:hypothetical protein BC628DRAFT_1411920 [Trametes gibbosa]|nr:hypothetical protein BC628DRAFT_1411920 [Trametes gibbosa]
MIRKSNLRGFNILGTVETLKATLFADNTTVYLSEDNDFGTLQAVLDTWCSAVKAKFNIKKTGIIPIGQLEYYERVAKTYQATGHWKNYPQNVHIAKEAEPVRILGTFFRNDVSEAAVWTPKINKLVSAIEKWKVGRTTLEGKRHVSQMMIGGMTQFLTDVQWMPAPRNYLWDDKHNIPVSMAHMCNPFMMGGFNILDLKTQNEAIDVM